MCTLFLDVASHEGLLACSTEERVVVHRTIDHRISDHELIPLIEDTLCEAGWSHKDLTHLACVIGPGGFTSLRVGVSCVNALSWALKIPVAGVHLSDLYAARMSPTPQPPPPSTGRGGAPLSPAGGRGRGWGQLGRGKGVGAIWLHSTKRTELFIRGFGGLAQEWPQPTHIIIEDLLRQFSIFNFQFSISYVGELLPEHQKLIEGAGALPISLCPVTDVLPRLLASLPYKNQVLEPWYGRGW